MLEAVDGPPGSDMLGLSGAVRGSRMQLLRRPMENRLFRAANGLMSASQDVDSPALCLMVQV